MFCTVRRVKLVSNKQISEKLMLLKEIITICDLIIISRIDEKNENAKSLLSHR